MTEPTQESPQPVPSDAAPGTGDDLIIARALRWSLGVGVLIAGIVVGVLLLTRQREAPAVTESHRTVLPEFRKRPQVELPRIPFTDITPSAGIDFVHENGAFGEKLLPETMGGGCAFLDFDSDGDPDILLVNSMRWPWDPRPKRPPATLALYRNDGTGRFENVTATSGLNVSLYGMGAAVGDYDNDGDPDLFVSALGPNRLFRNDGGRFVDVTETMGVAGEQDAWSTSCGWFDYDNDGDLDLFVANYVVWSRKFDLAQPFTLTGQERAYGRPQDFPGTFPYLYRNDGDRFTEVGEAAGLHVRNPSTGTPMAKSLGVLFGDPDDDGRLDIIVANDTVRNFLFRNRGDGTFEEIGRLAGVAFDIDGNARGAMGIDAAHLRGAEQWGIAIGNFATEMTALYVSDVGRTDFTDEAVSNGLGPATRLQLTFGVFFFDADLDGRADLFQANGHLETDIHRVQPSQHYEQPPQLLWNCGPQAETEFQPLTEEQLGTEFVRPMVGRGAAFADIDADGDLDILITAVGGRPRLLRNDQNLANHWLRIRLEGRRSNRDAIGALVTVVAAGEKQMARVMPTRSYLSQCERELTFGLGKATNIEEFTVRWPSGTVERFPPPQVDRLIHVVEGTGTSLAEDL